MMATLQPPQGTSNVCSQENLEACVCESCYRLFHIECLTPMETTRWKSVVGTSEPYYCMTCSKDNKHVELNPQATQMAEGAMAASLRTIGQRVNND
jgi:hypothetical protein